jgi:hypothetical protein
MNEHDRSSQPHVDTRQSEHERRVAEIEDERRPDATALDEGGRPTSGEDLADDRRGSDG